MHFLQPAMLWALPAILIPVAVHLLNKMRYKTVDWAAMHFLLKLQKASARRAKLMEMLLLATRILLVLAIVLAFSRPLSGGWLSRAISNDPECVLILLDRSLSMGERVSIGGISKLERALEVIKYSAEQRPANRYVLLENVLRQPLELADLKALDSLDLTTQTETAANIPAMFQSAVEYLVQNKVGKSEVWVFSDLQASNWRSEDPSWKSTADAMSGLGFATGVYVMDLSSSAPENTTVSAISAELREVDGYLTDRKRDAQAAPDSAGHLAVKLAFTTTHAPQMALPLAITVNGARSQTQVPFETQRQTHLLRIPYQSNQAGWGKCEIPADLNQGDNSAYFVWPETKPADATIIGDSLAARRLQLACAPEVDSKQRTARIIPAQSLDALVLERTDLLIWADGAPSVNQGSLINQWLRSGGALLAFPPSNEGASGLEGIAWNRIETGAQPFPVTSWDEHDGPLSKTESGANLPLHLLSVTTRQTPVSSGTSHVVATFSDGQSFLTRVGYGKGQIYLAATRPSEDWSSLHEGAILVPLVQRVLMEGRSLREPPTNALAGEWSPDSRESWSVEPESVQGEQRAKAKLLDPRWNSGVFRSGNRIMALNRPPIEDIPEVIQPSEVQTLLPGSQTHVFKDTLHSQSAAEASELWPMLMGAVLALAILEAMLSTNFTTKHRKTPVVQYQPDTFGVSSIGKTSS
jgi:hypothetical protein